MSGLTNKGAGLAVSALLLKPSNGSEVFALKPADGAGDDFVEVGCLGTSSVADATPRPDNITETPTDAAFAADTCVRGFQLLAFREVRR
jgi:hypothetical protein